MYIKLFFGIILLHLCACTNQRHTTKVDFDNGWSYKKGVLISVPSGTNCQKDKLALKIEFNDQYPFKNIYLKYIITTESDSTIQKIESLPLQNQQGQWIGKSTNNGYVYTQELIDEILHLKSVELFQYSRKDTLLGIVGVELLWTCTD